MSKRSLLASDFAEIIDDSVFTVEELARMCGVSSDWVYEHVQDGILRAEGSYNEWRFDSFSLIRARRVIHLETAFDADPQLAALTADLIDEVLQLRQQLSQTDKD